MPILMSEVIDKYLVLSYDSFISTERRTPQMSDKKIIELYSTRQFTIRELSIQSGRPYEEVRQILVKAGYQYGRLM